MTATSAFGPVFNTSRATRPTRTRRAAGHLRALRRRRRRHDLPARLDEADVPPHGRASTTVDRHRARRARTARRSGARTARRLVAPDRLAAGREGIATRDVIGHAESLSSPYHRERVARLAPDPRRHGAPTMRRYRARLGGRGRGGGGGGGHAPSRIRGAAYWASAITVSCGLTVTEEGRRSRRRRAGWRTRARGSARRRLAPIALPPCGWAVVSSRSEPSRT